MPFDDDFKDIEEAKIKPRTSTKGSMFDKAPQLPITGGGKNATSSNATGYLDMAAKLSLAFKAIVEDKSLPQNQSELHKTMERETIQDLITLAQAMNDDEAQEAQMGSLGLITLLFKMTLIQRDRINELEYYVRNNNFAGPKEK